MSRFRIYQINHPDPIRVGRKNRRLFTIYSLLAAVIVMIVNINTNIDKKSIILSAVILPITVLAFLFLILKLKLETKKIKTIGDIEFTTTAIKKRIGDSYTEYKYYTIKEIEIQKHIPAFTSRDSKSGYFSYVLKIIFTNLQSESIVVSDKSIDSKHKLSIIETMKTLKRMTPFEIKLP